jgi:hypothetical protein
MSDSSLSGSKNSANDKLREFIQPSTEEAGNSNPTPVLFSELTGVMGELFTQPSGCKKQSSRLSTTRSAISTLKAVAKEFNLLNQ